MYIYICIYIYARSHTHFAWCYGHRAPTCPQNQNNDADVAVFQPRPSLE